MAEQAPLNVTTTETSPVVRTLEIEVDAARVRKAFDRVYKQAGKGARVKGFRPGKVPHSVLEKLYGSALAEEAERLLVAETLGEAIEQSGVDPLGEPSIDATPPAADQAYQYTVRLEVRPQFELGEVRGLPAERPKVEVGDDEIQRELEALQQRQAPLVEEPADTPVAHGHVCNLDFVGRIDGEAFEGGTGKDMELEIGSGRFIGDFEDQLVGSKQGDDVQVNVSFPEDYGSQELAGKPAVFDVHIASVRRREIPELDDEFAKDLGDEFESLDQLRERIRSDMTESRERSAKTQLDRSLMDALIERTEFEVPPGMLERRLQGRLAQAHQQLSGSLDDQALHAQLDRWREEWRPQAERDVREALLLDAVAEQQGFKVEDAAVDERVAEMAEQQGVSVAKLRELYEERGLIEGMRAQLRDEQALEFLRSEAKIKETTGS